MDFIPKQKSKMIISSEAAATHAASDAAFDEDELEEGSGSGTPLAPEAAHIKAIHRFNVSPEQHGQRLDRVLTELLPDSSRSFLQQLIDSGDVLLGEKAATKASIKLKAGEQLVVRQRPLPQETAFVPDAQVARSLAVVHEDAHLMVINKQPGLVVHPAAGNWSGTLLNGLLAHHECHTLLPRAGIVHRLDKDTSGLMVVARTREAMDALIRMIAAREVKRQYVALAHYPWRGDSPRHVDAPIGRDPRNRQRMAVVDLAQYPGKEAMTDFELLSHSLSHWPASSSSDSLSKTEQTNEDISRGVGTFPSKTAQKALSRYAQEDVAADAYCLLRCHLHTGRTHQIRVHASHIHHPLIADSLYGGRPAGGITRQALHAERLAFAHPISGQELAFEAGLAPDLLAGCAALGLDYNA
jgi:23S rRNA pseudouridine1911/1915/1917 synthase